MEKFIKESLRESARLLLIAINGFCYGLGFWTSLFIIAIFFAIIRFNLLG